MKEIVSITELAKLRHVSTETLRHYDRIDLLKPKFLNDKSGMRYYSIYQYEKLGTIKELQQLGMSLQDIKRYFEDRDIKKTYDILSNIGEDIDTKIENLYKLKNVVEAKLSYIESLLSTNYDDKIREKRLGTQYFLCSGHIIHDEIELSYNAIELEGIIKKYEKFAPIFATNRYAGIISKDSLVTMIYDTELAIKIDKELVGDIKEPVSKIDGGNYVSACYIGSFWDRKETLDKLIDHIDKKNFTITGDAIQLEWYDYTITNNENDIIYEVLIPIL